MPAALSLKKTRPQTAETLTAEITDRAVLSAARHLISRRRAGQAFDIEAFDIPHRALADIAEKLEAAGISHALAVPLMDALRRYVLASGSSFTRAVNAKPVVIRLTVADRMPDRRFDRGMTELACIGAMEARVEGAASINVRATPTGTTTTSNAADVDAMFASVRGLNLWIRYEAPTRDEMDALVSTMEASLASVVQSVGGAVSPSDLKNLLAKLEQNGALTPAAMELVDKILLLQEGHASRNFPEDRLHDLLADIAALIRTAHAERLIPSALVQAALLSLKEVSSSEAVITLLKDHGIVLPGTAADNDNIPADPEAGRALLSLFEIIAARIEAGAITAGSLPPELAALIEEMGGIETLLQKEGRETRIQNLSEALIGADPSPLSQVLHAAVMALAALNQSPAMSSETIRLLQDFVKNHPAIMEAAVTNSLVRQMTERLGAMDPSSPEGTELARAIALLKQDGFIALMDKNVQGILPAEAKRIVQGFVQDHPGAIEMLVTHSIVSEMKAMMAGMDPVHAVRLNEAIDLLKSQGFSALLDSDIQATLPPETVRIIQNFSERHPAAIEIAATSALLSTMDRALASVDPASPAGIEILAISKKIEAQGATEFLERKSELQPQAVSLIERLLRSNAPRPVEKSFDPMVMAGWKQNVPRLLKHNESGPKFRKMVPVAAVASRTLKDEGINPAITAVRTVTKNVADAAKVPGALPDRSQASPQKKFENETGKAFPEGQKIQPALAEKAQATNASDVKAVIKDCCPGPCAHLENLPASPTKQQWADAKERLETLAQDSAVNSSGRAVPIMQLTGDEKNPVIVITHPETDPAGNPKVTTMTFSEFRQDAIDNLKAREELAAFSKAHVSTDALRHALSLQSGNGSLHVHFGDCCGTEGKAPKPTTAEQDKTAVASSMTVIAGEESVSDLDLGAAAADSRTKAMDDAFGFGDFKL